MTGVGTLSVRKTQKRQKPLLKVAATQFLVSIDAFSVQIDGVNLYFKDHHF